MKSSKLFSAAVTALSRLRFTPGYKQFIPSFLTDHLKLHQIEWETSVICHLHISPQMVQTHLKKNEGVHRTTIWSCSMCLKRSENLKTV